MSKKRGLSAGDLVKIHGFVHSVDVCMDEYSLVYQGKGKDDFIFNIT